MKYKIARNILKSFRKKGQNTEAEEGLGKCENEKEYVIWERRVGDLEHLNGSLEVLFCPFKFALIRSRSLFNVKFKYLMF